MTPAARCASSIEILDNILLGQAAEQVLTNWARGHRFAGSGDRAAIRNLVYDALRCKRSYAAQGGALTGRGIIIGGLIQAGQDLGQIFTGEGYAPTALTASDGVGKMLADLPQSVRLDCPEELAELLKISLQTNFEPVMHALKSRAPLFLRVNQSRLSVLEAIAALEDDGIETKLCESVEFALEVTKNPRMVQNSWAYLSGAVEIQDLSSQAVIAVLPDTKNMRILDYCAGGGGKTLALAARGNAKLFVHDAHARRMVNLPARAKRAGAEIITLETADLMPNGPYDLVLTDVPCSGSGSWRRDPESKWAITPEGLALKTLLQAKILDDTSSLVVQGGLLVYITCSILACENQQQILEFLVRNQKFKSVSEHSFLPLSGGDGFFVSVLKKFL
ncbi:MAG: 16S rRNA (cytosine967-C5)-methyltransferase [Paracoccaceae bacterium]|jgi:16S rRNA (cytosine967-C5)-methyltransferase